MNFVSHIPQSSRHGWGSLGQTVGNSAKYLQVLDSGRNSEKPIETRKISLRLVFILLASPSIENTQQPPQSPRYILWGFTYGGMAIILKCGEGVASRAAIAELTDYYPYGSQRQNTGTLNDRKGYIGVDLDSDTGLNQFEARYYKSNVGRFISQDPVFWEVGQTSDGKAALSNPQTLNSYSYAGNNPIVNKDPSGRFWWVGFYDWTGYDGLKGVGMKTLEVFGGHSRAMNSIERNQSTVNGASARYGVDPTLSNAVLYEEQSHLLNFPGLPFESIKDYVAPNSQLGGYDGGVGEMQVTGKVGKEYGYTKEELARDPKKNIDAGIGNLSKVQSNSAAMTASRYNYGSAQSVTSYGQRVGAQVGNPNYNTNVIAYGLQQIISGLQGLINSLRK